MLPLSVIVNAILRPLLGEAFSEDRARIQDIEQRTFNYHFDRLRSQGASLDEVSEKARWLAEKNKEAAQESPDWTLDDNMKWHSPDSD